MGDTESDGDKSSPDEHYTLHRPKEILHKCKSDPGHNLITGTETPTSTDDLVTEHVRCDDQSSITCDNAGVDKISSTIKEQTNIPYSKTINCTSSRLISPGNISCTSRHSVGNVADTINCSSSSSGGDNDTIGYDGDENIPQNAMYSRGSFSTRSLRYPSSLGTNISSGYHLTGGTTTRKCVLTLDGYSYVIVASTPENRINNRDDSVTAPPVLERRGYEKSKSNSPTSSQSSCPLNGQVAKQGGLTIVRRSNSRKGNLTYQGATTPTTDQQPSYEQHLLPSSSGAILNLDDQQQQLLETSFITSGGSDTIPSATLQTSTITNTFRTIDQLTPEQYSLLSANNTINTTTIATTNMQTATIKSNTSTTTTPTGDNNAVTIGGSNINNAVTGYSTPASYGDIDIETIDLATETLPAVDTPDACDKAAVRLRCLLRLLQRGEISAEVLQKNLHYAARVLEAVFIDETKSPRSRINSTISVNNDNNCTNKQGQINEKTENDQDNAPINKSTTTTTETTTNCNISNNKINNFNNNNDSSSNNNSSNISNNKTSSCYETDAQAINNPTDTTNQILTTGNGRTKGVSTAPQTHSGPTGPPLSLTQIQSDNNIVQSSECNSVKCNDSSVTTVIDNVTVNSNLINNSSNSSGSCSADGNNINNSGNQQNINNSNQVGGIGGVTNKTTVQRRRLRAPVWAKTTSTKIRLADEDDELSEVQPDAVPPEVREWLASTFTRQLATARKRTDEKPKFRSVAHAIRAGIFVDRIYRRVSSSALMQFPPEVVKVLKTLDDWSFDVFALAEAANGQPVKYLGYDLLNRYGMIHKFKIPPATLEIFLNRIEEGYCRFHNPYHNNLHAADVTQTTHHILCQTGLMNWLTDLEIFATLLAALIHDFEHTGTTNNFHVMSGSETAMLYNDRAVLENHHISAAFRVLKEDDANVLANLSREEYRELRTLVIDMVLSTDMSYHFQQLKNMKNLLTIDSPTVDKSKALSLVLHCCDISHPAKKWSLHHRWTMLLLEEFFRQGDLERELGLPFSPLCDRNNTLVAESQIGFIDFIVDPSMTVCSDMLEYILAPITPIGSSNTANTNKNNDENVTADSSSSGTKKINSITNKVTCEPITEGVELAKNGSITDSDGKQKFRIRKPWNTTLAENKKIWKEQAVRDAEARAATAALTEAEENKDGNQQEIEKTTEGNDDTTTTTTTAEQQD